MNHEDVEEQRDIAIRPGVIHWRHPLASLISPPPGPHALTVRRPRAVARKLLARISRYTESRNNYSLSLKGAASVPLAQDGRITRRFRPDRGPVTCDVRSSQYIAANS